MHGRLKQSNEMQRSGKENNQGARLSRGKRTTRSIALHQILDMPSNQCIIQVWYTSSSLFPYLYDFTLNTFIYYFTNTTSPGHYTANPRYFVNLTTQKIFTM